MNVLEKLAVSLGRRDEVPNQELAAEIVRNGDRAAVAELVENTRSTSARVRHGCIKVLYEIGYSKPELIAENLDTFVDLIEGRDNRMQWGAMAAMACIAKERPKEIFDSLGRIVEAANRGSVITRDNCVAILTALSGDPAYRRHAFPLLMEQLIAAPPNQLPMYAERALPVIDAAAAKRFVQVLESRLDGLERESGRKRIERVIRKVRKGFTV